ncbi:MAG: hypothetical protein ACKPCP_30520 [Sphaerospermopsis kisseleviana]
MVNSLAEKPKIYGDFLYLASNGRLLKIGATRSSAIKARVHALNCKMVSSHRHFKLIDSFESMLNLFLVESLLMDILNPFREFGEAYEDVRAVNLVFGFAHNLLGKKYCLPADFSDWDSPHPIIQENNIAKDVITGFIEELYDIGYCYEIHISKRTERLFLSYPYVTPWHS